MKNLNKKIGAIALAGMMVAGGFVASGVRAYADASEYESLYMGHKLMDLSEYEKQKIKEVEDICQKQGMVVYDVAKYGHKMDKLIERHFERRFADEGGKELRERLLKRIPDIPNEEFLGIYLKSLKMEGKKYSRVNYGGFHFLVLLQSQNG